METKEVVIRNDALLLREEWIAERDKLIKLAGNITTVKNDDDLKFAGNIQSAITKHVKMLDAERRKVTGPIDAIKKEIMSSEKTLKAELETELERVKKINTRYATEKLRRENGRIERERQEAAERESERMRKAEEDAKRQAEESAFGENAQFAPVEEPDLIPEPEIKPVSKPKLDNNRMVTRWSMEIANPNAVPREFCTPDEKKIRSYMNYQVKMGATPALDGVKFTSRVSVETR